MPAVKTFDLSTWDGFSELPKQDLDYLLDTTAMNKKMADKMENPYRWREGSFKVDKGMKGDLLRNACDLAIRRFVESFERQGWQLASKVQVYPGQATAFDIRDGLPILDKREIRVRAIFKTEPKPVRIELPPSAIKQDRDHKATLKEVMRGEGIKAVPIKARPHK